MTRNEARIALAALAQAATDPTLTDAELDIALTASRLPDNAGRPPSDPAFVEENWDLNYAAAECFEMKYAKQAGAGTVTKFSSEGASFETTPPDFLALAEFWRDKSTVGDSSSPSFVAMDNRVPYRLRPRSELQC
jgi:hypothetical protein